MTNRLHCEDAPEFSADAYQIVGWQGVAWSVLGWETEPDQDTEWTGMEIRTGNLVARMVGDDRDFSVEPDDVSPLSDDDYCSVCGQIGCHHNA
jgi:hypothetical protein